MSDFFIPIDDLRLCTGTEHAPHIRDVRRRSSYDADPVTLPAARWREPVEVATWAVEFPLADEIVLACEHGQSASQLAAAVMRTRGLNARVLADGIEGWKLAGGPTILKAALPGRDEAKPSRWVTRVRPKIDRIACPWLIRRFIDRQAEFTFVEPAHVADVAKVMGAIPYDVEDAEISHDGPLCTFDTLIHRFGLNDPALDALALIVRGADTARLDLAPEAAGLLAVSLGISALAGEDDHAALARGFPVYDALYAWRRHAATETHNWPAQTV